MCVSFVVLLLLKNIPSISVDSTNTLCLFLFCCGIDVAVFPQVFVFCSVHTE